MPLDLSRIQALCFDVDGTLIDTDDEFVRKLAGWLQPLRWAFPSRDPRPFARRVVMATETPGNFLLGLPDRLGIDDELAALLDALYHLGLGQNPEPFVLVPGVIDLLAQLHQRYPLSLVTTRHERTALRFVNQFSLGAYFKAIAGGQTCPHTKPYPDPILWTAAQMGVSPQACLMIGDTPVDIRAGKAAGAQTVGVLCGFGQAAELRKAGADLIVPSTAHLAEVLAA
jgi:phosphoglycolate phosphatase-like HAD superfamily hydrolase